MDTTNRTGETIRLPRPLTPLIGREREVEGVKRHLWRDAVRLVTLTGPGGVGKTRLAIEAARAVGADFAKGTVFVDLTHVTEHELVPFAIAQTLGDIGESDGRSLDPEESYTPIGFATPGDRRRATGEDLRKNPVIVSALINSFRDYHLLLVLDNFEHVLGARGFVAHLLAEWPRLKILTTSRARLGVNGEQVVKVLPLPLPDARAIPAVESVEANAAVRLFVERAVALDPAFALTSQNSRAVADIVWHVDGLPLAIELAAGWTNVLSPRELLTELKSRGLPEAADGETVPERHRSLEGVIDACYERLSPSEKALFRRLGIFAGGCTTESATAVVTETYATGKPLPPAIAPPPNVLIAMRSLVDRSLLRAEDDPAGGRRFTMLETVRAYALRRLVAEEEASTRHALDGYLLALAEEAESGLAGSEQAVWLDRLQPEHLNLSAAIESALVRGEGEIAVRFGAALWRYWQIRGYLDEGYVWLTRGLAAVGERLPAVRAKALYGLGSLAFDLGDFARAGECFAESLSLRQEVGDDLRIAESLTGLGMFVEIQGEYERATKLHQEALAIRRARGDQLTVAKSLYNLGFIARDTGKEAEARVQFLEALRICNELGIESSMSCFLRCNLGVLARLEGKDDEAARWLEESLAGFRRFGDKTGMGTALTELAGIALRQGADVEACRQAGEALTLLAGVGALLEVVQCVERIGEIAVALGEPERAAELLGAAAAFRTRRGLRFTPPSDGARLDRFVTEAARMAGDGWTMAKETGRTMTLDQAVEAAKRIAEAGQSSATEDRHDNGESSAQDLD
jgi:predicted ATPase